MSRPSPAGGRPSPTWRQPSGGSPVVAAPVQRSGGAAPPGLPAGTAAPCPSDGPGPGLGPGPRVRPAPSEGKSSVLLSKASSTLQNMPPRFCRGRGLPAPSPAKQAGSASACRPDMPGTPGPRPAVRPPGPLGAPRGPAAAGLSRAELGRAGLGWAALRCPQSAAAPPGRGVGAGGARAAGAAGARLGRDPPCGAIALS